PHPTLCGLLLLSLVSLSAAANEIGFVEDFALSPDRPKVLQQLIPGTEDYYYYHCLDFQHKGNLEKVEEFLKPWQARYGRTERLEQILNRQALLSYEKDPKKTLEFLRWRLGLNFNHQRELLDQKPNLATRLDPASISREKLTQTAFACYNNTLKGFQ